MARHIAEIRREMTMCKRGHPLFGQNLYQAADGKRQCRACKAMWAVTHRPKRVGVSFEDAFMTKVKKDGGCWLWLGSVHKAIGYGTVSIGRHPISGKKTSEYAHRISHELFKGPIPVGLQIDHICRVRRCVNPSHLEAVSQAENIRRGFAARKAATTST